MALVAGDIFGVVRSVLSDPSPGVYWKDNIDFVPWLNMFQRWACGIKPDLFPIRVTQALVAGVDQTIPAGGHIFLKPYYGGGAGQAVFLMDLEDAKHTKFANFAQLPESNQVQVCFFEPTSPRRFQVGPPAATGATLTYDYGGFPASIVDATTAYGLGDETQEAAASYLLWLALRKNTDMQDLQRAKEFRQECKDWFGIRTSAQAGEKPTDDE